jgi:hypothetical protein
LSEWQQFISTLRSRMRNDWDNMIGIQGERGAGKSTLALWISLSLDPTGFKPNHVFYEPNEWKTVMHPKQKGQVYVLDEGTNIAFNRTWQNRDQISLMQLLNTVRQRNHTMIWCAPNLERMDTVIRGDIIKYRISVVSRGRALVQQRRFDYRKGTSHWDDKLWVRYGSLESHPFWPEYVRRKAMSYESRVNRTNATETVAASDSQTQADS